MPSFRGGVALKQESKKLLTKAEQQEKASNAAGIGGGPGTGGAGSAALPVAITNRSGRGRLAC